MFTELPVKTDDPAIVWDFYPGAYGPSILVELPDLAAAESLRDIFLRVAATGDRIDLSSQPRMRLENIARFELVRAPYPMRKALSRTNASFVWSCSPDQWDTLVQLLEPFLEGEVGHQYLTDHLDDAIIEVSFGERHS